MRRPDWMLEAPCTRIDPELWFPEAGDAGRIPKRVCHWCPVRAQCLQWALDTNEQHGIWGGQSPNKRRAMRRNDPLAS